MAKLNQHPEKALLPLIGVSILLLLGLVVMYFAQSQSTELRSKAAQFKGSCAAEERPRCKEGQKASCVTTKENTKTMKGMSKEEKKVFMESIADSFKWECQKASASNQSQSGSQKTGDGNSESGGDRTTGCTCYGSDQYCYDGDKTTINPDSPACL